MFVLIERKLRSGWDWIENRWILIKGAARKELNFSLRLYSATELGNVLRQGGFKAVEFFGSLAGCTVRSRRGEVGCTRDEIGHPEPCSVRY